MNERAFPFIRMNEREGKPRARGITEIRGPYYTLERTILPKERETDERK